MFKLFNEKISYKKPRNLLVLFELLALVLLFIHGKENPDKLVLKSGLVLVFIVYISNILLSKISNGDDYIFLIVTMLFSIGIMMIYRINPALGGRQVLWITIGIICFFLTYFILKLIDGWENWTFLYVAGSIGLFLITLIFADRNKGSYNWIDLKFFKVQPTEITKIIIIFLLASYYSNYEKFKKMNKYSSYYLMGLFYLFIGFLFLQRDLGTVLLFYGTFLFIQFIYEPDRKLIFYNLALFSVSAVLGIILFDHVKVRISIWIDPWKDISHRGYQITQSLFAIASGGFLGTGIGLGYPKFIPEVHTDFIFSAICEEMGIFTGMGIIMLFLILVYRGFKIGIEQENKFYRILALGISVLFGLQSFIILGGVMKMIPLTGITIPFVSYGGSSILSSFISLGILQVASEDLSKKEEIDGKE